MSEKANLRIDQVKSFFLELQSSICENLSAIDGNKFVADHWKHENGSGSGISCVLARGPVIEKGGVLFSHVSGDSMPASATAKRSDLAGKSFQAMGVSLVIHPRNPFAPTAHMNVRFFIAGANSEDPIWWFGGGFDLTPYYGFDEDAIHWHQVAQAACEDFGSSRYREYKANCDEYFFLPHRQETRGVGGLFFDDLSDPSFDDCFSFIKNVGQAFIPAYAPILNRRKDSQYQEKHRQWQLLRRGRYVEFNLVFDRGTLFGLQSGGRTESILVSMPPLAAWEYRFEPEEGSAEYELIRDYLKPRDWLE